MCAGVAAMRISISKPRFRSIQWHLHSTLKDIVSEDQFHVQKKKQCDQPAPDCCHKCVQVTTGQHAKFWASDGGMLLTCTFSQLHPCAILKKYKSILGKSRGNGPDLYFFTTAPMCHSGKVQVDFGQVTVEWSRLVLFHNCIHVPF